jgi:hypothetical protein
MMEINVVSKPRDCVNREVASILAAQCRDSVGDNG